MPRWLPSVNPLTFDGLGVDAPPPMKRNVPFIPSGPVPVIDLNTPYENKVYRDRARAGQAMRRRDHQATMRGGRRAAARNTTGRGFGDDSFLGLAPLAVAAAPKIVSGVKSLFGHPDDPARVAKTKAESQSAQQGNVNAAWYVLQRTGRYGTKNVPTYGLVGPWPTSAPEYTARVEWQKILAAVPAVAAQALARAGGTIPASPTVVQSAVAALPANVQSAARSLVQGTAVESALFNTAEVANTAAPSQSALQAAQERVADASVPVAQAGFSGGTLALMALGAYLVLGKRR